MSAHGRLHKAKLKDGGRISPNLYRRASQVLFTLFAKALLQ